MGPTGVLLLTFGSAVTADDVPAYLRSVRGGSDAGTALVDEFQRRFRRIGRSPLIDISLAQAGALQRVLDERHGPGSFRVGVGMQHSSPWIGDAVAGLVSAGCRRILAVVLAPQYSPLILAGYERAVARARIDHPDADIRLAGAWHTMPGWIESLTQRVTEALDTFPADARPRVPIIFTAHSLPRQVVDRDPGYIDQLRETIAAVVAALGIPPPRWHFAWQSAGHTPEEWLKPDLLDVLPEVARSGAAEVLVVPVQFLADHLEVLYDIDIAAAEQAAAAGVALRRVEMPNTSPAFIEGLAQVVDREMVAAG